MGGGIRTIASSNHVYAYSIMKMRIMRTMIGNIKYEQVNLLKAVFSKIYSQDMSSSGFQPKNRPLIG